MKIQLRKATPGVQLHNMTQRQVQLLAAVRENAEANPNAWTFEYASLGDFSDAEIVGLIGTARAAHTAAGRVLDAVVRLDNQRQGAAAKAVTTPADEPVTIQEATEGVGWDIPAQPTVTPAEVAGPVVWIQTTDGGRTAGRIVRWDENELVYVANLKSAPIRRLPSAMILALVPATETSLPARMRKI